jgi:hypothetical protein
LQISNCLSHYLWLGQESGHNIVETGHNNGLQVEICRFRNELEESGWTGIVPQSCGEIGSFPAYTPMCARRANAGKFGISRETWCSHGNRVRQNSGVFPQVGRNEGGRWLGWETGHNTEETGHNIEMIGHDMEL